MRGLIVIFTLLLASCSRPSVQRPVLSSINLVDQNGMTQRIGSKERLKNFETVDFLKPQAYQKVLRVYTPRSNGEIPAQVTSYYPSGQVKQSLDVVSGRAFGSYLEWYESGSLKVETAVVGGAPELSPAAESTWIFNGLSKAYDEEGRVMATLPYERGLLNGVAHTYGSDGSLKTSLSYCRGVLMGKALKYRDGGLLISEENYQSGLLQEGHYFDASCHEIAAVQEGNGVRYSEFEEGYRLEEIQAGRVSGEIKEYKNELLAHRYCQKKGQKEGLETFYNSEGTQVLQIPYVEGHIHGEITTRYPNGSLQSLREMTKSQKNGLLRVWYPDGQIMMVEEYSHDVLQNGSYYKPSSNAPVSQVTTGSGTVSLFDPEGRLERKISYLDGNPLR